MEWVVEVDIRTLVTIISSKIKGQQLIDDKTMIMERTIQLVAGLPHNSRLREELTTVARDLGDEVGAEPVGPAARGLVQGVADVEQARAHRLEEQGRELAALHDRAAKDKSLADEVTELQNHYDWNAVDAILRAEARRTARLPGLSSFIDRLCREVDDDLAAHGGE